MRFSPILTSEQARMLFDLVSESREKIIGRWSFGIFNGLQIALMRIDRGGGALLRNEPTVLDYGYAVEAAVVPPETVIACPGVQAVPRAFWNLAGMLPRGGLGGGILPREDLPQPVTIYRAKDPLVVLPLVPTIVPLLPLK